MFKFGITFHNITDVLIGAGDYQKNVFKTTGKFDFNTILEQIDCAVDLYSFGFMLKNLQILHHSEDKKAWHSFENEYQTWVNQLLSLSRKKTPFKDSLPHQHYIHQIDSWIAGVTKILGYDIHELNFVVAGQIERRTLPIRPIPTPTLSTATKPEKNKSSNLKRIGVIIGIFMAIVIGLQIFNTGEPEIIPEQDFVGALHDSSADDMPVTADTPQNFDSESNSLDIQQNDYRYADTEV